MPNAHRAIAVYDTHTDAEAAVKSLQRSGFDMRKVSIVGKDFHTDQHVIGFLNAGDRARIFGRYAAIWGGLMGALFGSAMLFIPLVGHIVVLGPFASALVNAIEGAAVIGGAGALAGALSALGIPRDSVLSYENAIKADKYLLVIDGNENAIEQASDLLRYSSYSTIEMHQHAH